MKKIFLLMMLSLFCALHLSCNSGEQNDKESTKRQNVKKSYYDENAILETRKQKDSEFKAPGSPIPDELQKSIEGLNYFKPSRKFVVLAEFAPYSKQDTVIIATTKKEDLRKMLRYGKFTFSIGVMKCELTGYISPKHPELIFVPFGDETNGKASYDGGRYLDIDYQQGAKEYIIDFNLAYNPYCVYNKKYSCPLVPQENILKVPIRAGEKKFKKSELKD